MYWFFAKNFGFEPDMVDKLPYDRVVYMMDLEIESQKQQKNSMK